MRKGGRGLGGTSQPEGQPSVAELPLERDLGEPCCEWAQQWHEGTKKRGFAAGGTVAELNVHGGDKTLGG